MHHNQFNNNRGGFGGGNRGDHDQGGGGGFDRGQGYGGGFQSQFETKMLKEVFSSFLESSTYLNNKKKMFVRINDLFLLVKRRKKPIYIVKYTVFGRWRTPKVVYINTCK